MERTLIIRKIVALLHDSPDKALILGRLGSTSHEDRARRLIEIVFEGTDATDDEIKTAWEMAKNADHHSSAADRINLPKYELPHVDFTQHPVVVHPLSGQQHQALQPLTDLQPPDVVDWVDTVVRDLVAPLPTLESRYWAIWRSLLPRLQEAGAAGPLARNPLGMAWELLPADTRVPDHTIWDHLRTTAAFAGALPQPALVYFTIGPVQSFIATARKTQDLWAGSYLLSWLSWIAMREVISEMGADAILFPDLNGQPMVDDWLTITQRLALPEASAVDLALPTLPNCFLALLPQARAHDLARQAEEAVRKEMTTIAQTVRTHVEERLSLEADEIWNEIWQRQIETMFDLQWVCVPFSTTPDEFLGQWEKLCPGPQTQAFRDLFETYRTHCYQPNIGTCYSQLFKLVGKSSAARKGVRTFVATSEPHQKCTLCGEREPVHPATHNRQSCETVGAMRGFWLERMVPTFRRLRASERLCAVCLTKRLVMPIYFRQLGTREQGGPGWNKLPLGFPSTQMIATAPFRLDVIRKMQEGHLELITSLGRFLNALTALVDTQAGADSEDEWSLFQEELALPMVWQAAVQSNLPEAKHLARLGGDWLFPDSWPSGENLPAFLRGKEALLAAARQALFDFLAEARRAGLATPTRYLAIIHMDGDHLGRWLNGELAPTMQEVLHPHIRAEFRKLFPRLVDQRRPLSPALQASISRALRHFNLDIVRELVERRAAGRLVYAGGDDVVALVPLRDLLEVMRRLRVYYAGTLHAPAGRQIEVHFREGTGFLPTDARGRPLMIGEACRHDRFLLAMGHKATASLGAAVFHHTFDLGAALEQAREEERHAKAHAVAPDAGGRNAFSVIFLRRSGSGERLTLRWHPRDDTGETAVILERWREAFELGWVSPSFVHHLSSEESGLGGEILNRNGQGALAKAMFLDEAKRLLQRQMNLPNASKEERRAYRDKLLDGLATLFDMGYAPSKICEALRGTVFLAREAYR